MIIAVLTGVIAAMSQLFAPPFNQDVEETRKKHRKARNERDSDRVKSVVLLEDIVNLNILPDSINKQAQNLVSSHYINEKKSKELFDELTTLKNSKKVNGFQNLNIFLASIGNPIFILVTGVLFMILFLNSKKIDWIKLSKSFFYLGMMYLFVASVYLFWVLSPSREIDVIYYLITINIAAIFAVIGIKKLLKYLFKINSIEDEKLLKAIRILFRQLLHTIPMKGYVKDEKFIEFTESNNEIINEVAKEID